MIDLQDPALTHLGRVADLLEEAAKEIRNVARSFGIRVDSLGGGEAECRPPAREPVSRECSPMPTSPIAKPPVLLTQNQVADLLQVGPRTVQRMRNDPTAKFPTPIKRVRVLRWRRAEIESWIAGRRS